MKSTALKNPLHWVISLSFFTTKELNTLTDHLTDEEMSKHLKHGLLSMLLTDTSVGLIRYATPAFALRDLTLRSAIMHEQCYTGSVLPLDGWGQIYRDSEKAHGLAFKDGKDAKRSKSTLAQSRVNVCVAEALRLATWRNNENPATITGLVEALATLARLQATNDGGNAKAAEAATRAELKRKIFEFLSAPVQLALAA